MKTKIKIIILITFQLLVLKDFYACTIISASNENVVLVGNNEDWIFPFTKVWFVPATKNEYGRVTFGYDQSGYAAQGGINSKGLFVDVIAEGNPGWRSIDGLEKFRADQDEILSKFASVDEVLDYCKDKNIPRLAVGKLTIADATGKSVIIEYGREKVEFLINESGYQISTGFFQSHFKEGNYPSLSYNAIDAVLRKEEDYTVDLMRKALSIAANEGNSLTQYSYIGDLQNGKIYLYHFHNFEEVVVFDIAEELAKGAHEYSLSALFPNTSSAYQNFLKRSTYANFINIIETENVETAIFCYKFAKNVSTRFYYDISESGFNTLGYRLMNEEKILDAIKIFKLNTELNPMSSNAFDSLGEAYLKNGQYELALQNYKRSLELNPDNENAKEMLKRLKN